MRLIYPVLAMSLLVASCTSKQESTATEKVDMEKNDYFTITHFPSVMREKLQYLGTASGRDEDKVKGAGLTVEFTELGNPIFAEADLAIECKKIYSDQFKADKMPLERRQWHEETGTGIHVMYVGEIVNVWKK